MTHNNCFATLGLQSEGRHEDALVALSAAYSVHRRVS